MYRLLIVDDEAAIVLGLEKMLRDCDDWELDIYKVYSAKEALAVAEEKQIDILMADINMPGMDGLEMARQIVKLNSECMVIYLTGFSSFDYIYEAMERIGSQYLLKSESEDKILEAVGKAISRLEEKRQERIVRAQMNLEKNKASSLLKKEVLTAYLKRSCAGERLETLFDEYQIRIKKGEKSFLFLGMQKKPDSREGLREKLDHLYEIKALMDERFSEIFSGENFMDNSMESLIWEEDQIIWILQSREDRVINWKKYFSVMAEELQNAALQITENKFDVGYTSKSLEESRLCDEVHGLINYMKLADTSGIPMIYDWDTCRSGEEEDLEAGMRRLENYIVDHIGEDISLAFLAGMVHFNPSYLSRYYKKSRGKNLSDFIGEIRIRKACEKLDHGEKRIADIAAELGFDTASAFGSFFRKKMGISPAQYRKNRKI